MKRKGDLYEQIAEINNLNLALQKACKGKKPTNELSDFLNKAEINLNELNLELLLRDVKLGVYNYFTIRDPKVRLICAATFKDRVLHHAIMNICHPIFERNLINCTYATRQGKGTYKAIEKAKEGFVEFQFVAKLDMRKYFDSIDQEILLKKLGRLFKDQDLLALFAKIVHSYETERGKGIPIGNLTSQYFANYYLSNADHFAKEVLFVPVYVRYMDDVLIFHDDLKTLSMIVAEYKSFLIHDTKLVTKPVLICSTRAGCSFLGYKLFANRITLNKRSKRRFIVKYRFYSKLYSLGCLSGIEYAVRIRALIAFTMHAFSKKFRLRVFSREINYDL